MVALVIVEKRIKGSDVRKKVDRAMDVVAPANSRLKLFDPAKQQWKCETGANESDGWKAAVLSSM